MKYSVEISKIVEGALKSDKTKVQSYTKLLIDKLKADGEERAANNFLKSLDLVAKETLEPMNMSNNFKVPVDFESRVPMADIILPQQEMPKVVLSRDNYLELQTFILSYKNADKLNSLGIGFGNTLLMYGPPGCGKTKSAYLIAKELELPLVIARLDSMISSYLGTTAKNIRNLFEYIQKIPCVLFLDEFDAIAKARDDSNELGELKRVVNSLLQNIDMMSEDSLLIAATNHEDLLDKAIWRRFNYKLKITLPDKEAIYELMDIFIKNKVDLTSKEKQIIAAALVGLSGADIEEILNKALRKSVIFGFKTNISSIFEEIFLFKNICANSNENSKERFMLKAKHLRTIDEKLFSYSIIGSILGVSKTQISNLLKIN